MDNLEWQLSNLELSKKLCELGVKQESLFYWYDNPIHGDKITYVAESEKEFRNTKQFPKMFISAFTVAELGEIFNNIGADKFIKAYGEVFNFKETQMVGTLGVINLMRKPDMGAKMLIYLIENKLINI